MKKSSLLVLIVLQIYCTRLQSADLYWISGSASNWNDGNNWSLSSGGPAASLVPGIGDIAVFDSNGAGNCTVDINISVDGLDIQSGYAGAIIQGSGNTIDIGTDDFRQAGGIFSGGNSDITISGGTFTLAGGFFFSTSAVLSIGGNQSSSYTPFSYTAGTFANSSGTVLFNTNWTATGDRTATISLATAIDFYDLQLEFDENNGSDPNNKFLASSGPNIIATNDFTQTDGVITGTIEVEGNLIIESDADGGTGRIIMNGGVAQTYAYAGTALAPELEVSNSSTVTAAGGTTTLTISALILTSGSFQAPSGTLTIGGNRGSSFDILTQSSGATFDANGGLTLFATNWTATGDRTATINMSEAIDFYDLQLEFDENNGSDPNNKFLASSGPNIIATNDFTQTDGVITGTIEVEGNLIIEADADGGTGRIIMNGGVAQTYAYAGTALAPELEVSNSSTVTAAGGTTTLTISALILTSGSFQAPSGTLTIGGNRGSSFDILTQSSGATFDANGGLTLFATNWTATGDRTATINMSEAIDFYDLQLEFDENNGSDPNNKFLASSGPNIIATNDFTQTDGVITGTIEVEGNLIIEADADGGTGRIIMNGGVAQTYAYAGTALAPELEVSNSSTVTAAGGTTTLTISALILTSGSFQAPSGTLTIGGNRGSSFDILTQSSGATFDANGGLTLFATNWTATGDRTATINMSEAIDFYDLQLEFDENNGSDPNNKFLASSGPNIIATNDFTQTDGVITGTFEVEGDLIIEADADGGTGRIIMNGGVAQTYAYAGTALAPELEVSNSSTVTAAGGTTTLTISALILTSGSFQAPSGTLTIGGNRGSSFDILTQSSGATFDANGGLTLFATNWTATGDRTATINMSEAIDFFDLQLEFDENNGSDPNNKFLASSGPNIIATNDFTQTDGVITGTIEVEGNLIIESDADGGTGRIIMNGGVAQTYAYAGTALAPELEVSNSSTVTAAGGTTTLTISALILTSGSFQAPSGTLTIGGNRGSSFDILTQSSGATFDANGGLTLFATNWTATGDRTATINMSEAIDFYDLQLEFDENNGSDPNNKFLASSGPNIIATNDFTQTDGVITGTFEVEGDLIIEADADGGTGLIIMNGGGASSYSYSGSARAPELQITNGSIVTPQGGTTDFAVTGLILTSGSLTGPTGTFSIGGNRGVSHTMLSQVSGTYIHNNGELSFDTNWTASGGRTATIDLTSVLDFYDVTFNNSGTNASSNKLIDIDNSGFNVENVLDITDDLILMSSNTITLENGATTALSRTTGTIRSETTSTSGVSAIQWNIGTGTGTYLVPFSTSLQEYIPFTLTITGAGVESGTGSFTFATYPTGADNQPLPTGVTNIIGESGTDNSAFVIDRFWDIEPDNYSTEPTADFTLTYVDIDWSKTGNTITESNLVAQRWDSGSGDWDKNSVTGTINTVANTLTANGVSAFSPWTLVDSSNPLPVELISFSAFHQPSGTSLHWKTATETNNDFFSVERSINAIDFETIGRVEGGGNSSSPQSYQFEDKHLISGIIYYRLKQVDFDGAFHFSETVFIDTGNTRPAFSVYPNPTKNNFLNLSFDGINGRFELTLIDIKGRELWNQEIVVSPEMPNYRIEDIDWIEKGVYYLMVKSHVQQYYYRLLKE